MTMKPSDHLLALVKAGMNAVPFVGGPLASLIGDYIPMSVQRSMERTIKILAGKLGTLEDRVDVNAVDKDEFAELFKSCYLIASRTHREEKLQAAASLIANLTLKANDPAKLPYEELDHYVRCLDSLSIGAISLLGAARAYKAKYDFAGGAFSLGDLCREFPGRDASFILSLLSELRSMNLVRVQEPAIRTILDDNYQVDLTPIGRRFIERIIEGKM